MTTDYLLPLAFGLGSALAGALICHFPARRGKIKVSIAILALLAALLIWLWFRASAAVGWDALGYFLIALFVVAPALAGGVIATLIARHRTKRDAP